jgi:hypothetical protein
LTGPFRLDLPDRPVSDRVAITRGIGPDRRETWAELDGPGCINHLWITLQHPKSRSLANRKLILRIYFDDAQVPQVEAPVGDFFGLTHGLDWYDINTEFLAVKAWSGYNSYFQMPFAKNARLEFETGPEAGHVYLQVDWHRYPEQELREPRRFCARWRRENPTQRYGEDYLLLDADGPGQLIGFVYGLRLIDNVDRWSHGGADNVYLDGDGEHPAYLRGIGGEDTFGTSYGGAQHPAETHLYAALPYYVHEDVGEARPAQRLAGYRFFVKDAIRFEKSIHLRFGCMQNDICSTVYWYQAGPVRPFSRLPDFPRLLPGTELKRGEMDLPLPDAGAWSVRGPLDNGFVDFNHVFRPELRGVGVHYRDKAAAARCHLDVPEATPASLRLAWDDRLILQVNDRPALDLGAQAAFRARRLEVPLRAGRNTVTLTLSNTTGSNHGGWACAFQATLPDGRTVPPQAE